MAMKQIRGFRIRLKLVKLIKWSFHEKHSSHTKLKPTNCTDKAMTRLCKFSRSLKKTVKNLFFVKSGLNNYHRVGHESFDDDMRVPKGHLAVYFGEEDEDICRVLVPVIYFNHPLFGDLLKEAEMVYGFDHSGGIHVPCRLSDFEDVQTRICAAGGRGGYGRSWRSWL